MSPESQIRRILDLSRWAPSGDNTQPWRFEIVNPQHVIIHGFDTRNHCVYDLDGHPSQIALGALLETASIAASEHGWRLQATHRADSPETKPVFDLVFDSAPELARDPLIDVIEHRSVQRRPMRTQSLTAAQKASLAQSTLDGHQVQWLEGFSMRLQTAKLMFRSAKIRLTSPEAYEVHRDIIDWKQQFSATKVPDQALGTDPLTTRLMQFVMGRWERVEFFNRYMAGTWTPRIQLDFLPSLLCGAHFALLAPTPPKTLNDYLAGGRAMQRFWLTATQLGLQLQPEITPLVFSRYAREGRPFSRKPGLHALAEQVKLELEQLLGSEPAHQSVFMGRLGFSEPASSRSLRRPLDELLIHQH